MAKAARSPLLGYNHNVKYGGHIFHVQTEDSGPGNPHLFTHLFFEGSILASKRCQYEPEVSEDEVRVLMQAQHKAILKELKQNVYDERIIRFFSLRGEEFPAKEFFPPEQETPAPNLLGAPAPESVPAPADDGTEMLDLDALPGTPPARHTPEPLPVHFTKPAVPGPGTYTLRRPAREATAREQPEQQQPRQRATTSPRLPATRPAAPVVVQRQVVVGAGAPATVSRKNPITPVRRRPVTGTPFVVKGGSHVNVAGAMPDRKSEPPPRSATPSPQSARPPQAAESKQPPPETSPSAFVTDQSLDDVILAYLSHGEGKR